MRDTFKLLMLAIGTTLGTVWMTNGSTPAEAALGRVLTDPSVREETVKGTIIALEKDMPRFVIGCPDGSVLQMQVEMKAVIQRSGSPIEFVDLRLGDQAIVKYRMRDGALLAYSVLVTRGG